MLVAVESRLYTYARYPRFPVDAALLPVRPANVNFAGLVVQHRGPLLTVTADAVLFEGVAVQGADDVQRARAIFRQWRELVRARRWPRLLYIAAPASTPLARLEQLVGSIRDAHLLLIREREAPLSNTGQSAFASAMIQAADAAPDRVARCQQLTAAMVRAVAPCTAAEEPARALAATTPACNASPPDEAGVEEARAVSRTLETCECGRSDAIAMMRLYEHAAARLGEELRSMPLRGHVEARLNAALATEPDASPPTVGDHIADVESSD